MRDPLLHALQRGVKGQVKLRAGVPQRGDFLTQGGNLLRSRVVLPLLSLNLQLQTPFL